MQHIESEFPAGTVVVAAAFQARWHEFNLSLDDLRVPEGTKLNLARSCDIAHNFNQGVRKMIGEWVWFQGDDHTFDPFILMNLLKHDKPIVQPLVTAKMAPFRPCLMKGPYKMGMPVYRWDELPTEGLFELPKGDFTGQAGMLVKKEVLEAMGDPWFMPGKLEPDRLQEDLYFCQRLQEMGYTIHIDCDQMLGHVGHYVAEAKKTEFGWCPTIKSGDKTLALPGLIKDQTSNMPTIGKGRTTQWAKIG